MKLARALLVSLLLPTLAFGQEKKPLLPSEAFTCYTEQETVALDAVINRCNKALATCQDEVAKAPVMTPLAIGLTLGGTLLLGLAGGFALGFAVKK